MCNDVEKPRISPHTFISSFCHVYGRKSDSLEYPEKASRIVLYGIYHIYLYATLLGRQYTAD